MNRFLRIAILASLTAYGAWRAASFGVVNDYDVYYRAGHSAYEVLRGNPVSFAVPPGETSPFRYPPFFAWVFMPFAGLPLPVGRAVWAILGWLAYAASLARLHRHFELSEVARWILLAGTIRFAVDNSNIGQISAILSWLLIEAALARGRPTLRGMALALGGSLKLQPLVLGALWVLRREWRVFRVFIGALIGVVTLSLTLGWEAFSTWLHLITQATQVLDPATVGNQSLYGALLRLVGPTLAPPLFATALAATASIGIRAWRLRENRGETYGWHLGLAALPIFGLVTWKNTYLLWSLPLAFLARRSPRLAFVAALLFVIPSQGIVGTDLNGLLLRIGFLPFAALAILLVSTQVLGKNPTPEVKPIP